MFEFSISPMHIFSGWQLFDEGLTAREAFVTRVRTHKAINTGNLAAVIRV
jgi:hypothetical protein